MDEVGVVRGPVCPRCGIEDTIPVVQGLPDAALAHAADRGLVVLAGCVVVDDRGAFHCRGCSHEWGSVDDPTADEQHLANLLGAPQGDVVRAIGTGWRGVGADLAAVSWFVSGAGRRGAVSKHQGPGRTAAMLSGTVPVSMGEQA